MASGLPYPVWVGLALLVASLVWRQVPENIMCGLAGFLVVTALGVAPCYIGVDAHGYRISTGPLPRPGARRNRPPGRACSILVRQRRPCLSDAVALVSTYSWNALLSRVSARRRAGREPAPSTIIAAIGSDPSHGSDFRGIRTQRLLEWKGGCGLLPIETDTHPARRFQLRLVAAAG